MPGRVWILWALFVARGTFYCALLPLWEGWDEYAHFAYLDHWNATGTLPRQDTATPREIDESMRLVPLARELRWIGPPYLTHSEWWTLPESEREARKEAVNRMPRAWQSEPARHPFTFYEAQQPPLYYWLMAVPLRFMTDWPIETRVWWLRILSMLLASAAIPLAWAAGSRAAGPRAALFCAGLMAVAPGFALDTARVANDSLAIAAAALFFWLMARGRGAVAAGIVLGICLLAKAYLLALIPALLILWWRRWRDLAVALGIGLAMAGWWYGRNVMLGYSLSGWLIHPAVGTLAAEAVKINWFAAAHVVAKSFVWFGGWSFLTMKRWIYAAIEGAGFVGLALGLIRWKPGLRAPVAIAAFYIAAMAYAVLGYDAAQHVPNIPGWYLWPVAPVLGILLAHGLGRFTTAIVAALAAIDLYGVIALLAPYYAGLVEHNHAGASQFFAALERLHLPLLLAVAWAAATAAVPILFIHGRERERTPGALRASLR
jgi:4-amino-4-deoxy-L-arabinose transferase-like glycosyltransferase